MLSSKKCANAESLFAESTDERLYDIRTRALKLWCDLNFTVLSFSLLLKMLIGFDACVYLDTKLGLDFCVLNVWLLSFDCLKIDHTPFERCSFAWDIDKPCKIWSGSHTSNYLYPPCFPADAVVSVLVSQIQLIHTYVV